MIWILVVIAAVLVSEALLRLPLIPVIREVVRTAQKSGRVLRSKRISDHWKEKALLRYSWVIARGSVLFLGMLMLALLPVAFLGVIYPGGIAPWGQELMRPSVMIGLCLVSAGYILVRTRVARV